MAKFDVDIRIISMAVHNLHDRDFVEREQLFTSYAIAPHKPKCIWRHWRSSIAFVVNSSRYDRGW